MWKAVVFAVQNPRTLFARVREYHASYSAERESTRHDLSQLRSDLENVQREEDRVLHAYRTGVMSVTQFESEIGKVNRRRAGATSRLSEYERANEVMPPLRADVLLNDTLHWARAVRERLGTSTDQERQKLLGALLSEIVIGEDTLRVVGEIPTHRAPESEGPGRGLSPTPSAQRGRKTAARAQRFAFELRLPPLRTRAAA